jgi:DNA adenine methylase
MNPSGRKNFFEPNAKPAKPFLKWAGGKGQLLEKFKAIYPEDLKNGGIKNYYEPFVGGGAVFFDIIKNYPVENIFLYDINEELILVYTVIKKNAGRLIQYLASYEKSYLSKDKAGRTLYFYEIRELYNAEKKEIDFESFAENWISRAAQAIFLNKTCFNGLFRLNSNGSFNTPAGIYLKPNICDEENILKVAALLQNAIIKCCGFEEILPDIKSNSFVYFDPPYRPISKTSNFTSYNKHLFSEVHQAKLADFYSLLNAKGCKLMLSNSDPKNVNPSDDFFDRLYSDFTIQRIPARRNINSDAGNRGNVNEIVVTNY